MSYFHPERMPVLPARSRAAARSLLVAAVDSSAQPRPKRKQAFIVAGAAVLVLATGAGFAVAEDQPVTNRAQARCYSLDDASASRYVSVGEASRPGRAADVRKAVSICASLFRQGILQVGVPGVITSPDTAVRHRVPALVACAMSSGIAAVFPGGHRTCAQLGLPSASGEP